MADGSIKISTELDTKGLESAMTKLGAVVNKGMKVAAGAVAATTSAFAGLTTKALKLGGDLEQSIGGIETLFKNSADAVIANSKRAYETAGVDANSYMEQVTSFSASLLQSLGGDTEKAAKVADMAVIDMADNANKMGSSIEDIQNAYQGFAKQNYTMLDNLKLGYGGTKSEMERLLLEAEKLSGVKYDISNLNDVYQAIHVIQTELDITGTTALEAASTLNGSLSMTKAAFSNFLSGAGDTNAFVDSFINLTDIVIDRLKELVPRLATGLVQIAQETFAKLAEILPPEVQKMFDKITNIGKIISEKIASPEIIAKIDVIKESFSELFSKLSSGDALDILAKSFSNLIAILIDLATTAIPPVLNFLSWMLDNMGDIVPILARVVTGFIAFKAISSVVTIITSLQTAFMTISAAIATAGGVLPALGAALTALASPIVIITAAIAALVGAFVYLFQTNEEFRENILASWKNIKESISRIIDGIIEIFNGFMQGLADNGTLQSMKETFINTWETIKESLATIFEALFALFDGIFKAIDSFLKEHGDTIKNVLVGAWTIAWNIIEPIIKRIGNIISTLAKIIKEVVDIIVVIINGDWSAVWEHVKNIVKIAVDSVSRSFENCKEFLGNIFKIILKICIDIWEDIKTSISEKVDALVKNVTKLFNEMLHHIGVAMGTVLNKITLFGKNFANWVQNDLPKIINNIVKWFMELPGKIWTELLKIIDKIKEFATNLLATTQTEVSKTSQKIIELFSELPGEMIEIGKNIIEGLINGIKSMAGSVWEAVTSVAENITKAVTDTLQIASPSKIMIQVGEFISIGLAEGIKDSSPLAENAAKDLAKSIIDIEIESTKALISEIEGRNKEVSKVQDLHDKEEKVRLAKNSEEKIKAEEELSEKLKQIELDAHKERLALLKEAKRKEEEVIKDAISRAEELQSSLAEALKKKYDEAFSVVTDNYNLTIKAAETAYNKEIELAETAANAMLKAHEKDYESSMKSLDNYLKEREKAYEFDYNARIASLEAMEKAELASVQAIIKALDTEKGTAVQEIQDKINAIDKLTEAENKAAEEEAHSKKLSELNKALYEEESAEKRAKIQEDINKVLADNERKNLLERRKEEKASLKVQITQVKQSFDDQKTLEKERSDNIKENYNLQKDYAKQGYNDQKQLLKEHSDSEKANLKENFDSKKAMLQQEISERKNSLSENYKNQKEGLQKEYDTQKEQHEKLIDSEKLNAEAKKLIMDKNQTEIISLLEKYLPKWKNKGKEAGEHWLTGLSEVENSIKNKVDEIMSAIDNARSNSKDLGSYSYSDGDSNYSKKEDYTSYTVKKGDNLSKIAKSYGVSVSDIADENSLSNKDLLQVGQNLKIPLFDNGGIVTGHMLAELAKNGKPEAIIPLDRLPGLISKTKVLQSNNQIDNGITIHFNNYGDLKSDLDIRNIGRELSERIFTEERRRGSAFV